MFKDRKEAGKLLSEKLGSYKGQKGTIVVGIPRGGVPVASEVAKKLNLPLDIVVTKKLGAPGNNELAIGAVGQEGDPVLDKDLIKRLQVDEDHLEKEIEEKLKEVRERIGKFRKGKEASFEGKVVILIDDGVATGSTVEAAVKYLREIGAREVVLAIPVAPKENVDELEKLADELYVLNTPRMFRAVGEFYKDFPQTSDDEVIQLLHSKDQEK